MPDNAGKLDKLSRLKSLRSGLKARSGPVAEEDELSLDTLFEGDKEESGLEQVPAPKKSASESPAPAVKKPEPAPAAKADEDAESLSAYFEALGIVPDGAKKPDATGTAPKPYAPPSSVYTKPDGKGVSDTGGRNVDVRDRWADPVREDDAYLSSFAGNAADPQSETPPLAVRPPVAKDAPTLAPDEPLATPVTEVAEVEERPADIDPTPEIEAETTAIPLEMPAPEEAREPPAPPDAGASDLDLPDDLLDDLPEDLKPDFDKTIDIEAFEREIAAADPVGKGAKTVAEAPDPAEPLTVTFDPDRAATLEQVSKQMGCSVDDVVVTAVDWYLDALLEEDGSQADSAGS